MSLKTKAHPRHKSFITPQKHHMKSPANKKIASPLPSSDFHSVSSDGLGHGDFHSGSSVSLFPDFIQDYGIDDPKSFILWNGTKAHPFTTFVDSSCPEKNGGMYGCDITM
eukprot:594981-Ditylum_brightwellii.AAC.1